MLSCKDASRLQSQSQDRPLGLAERFGLQLHMLICNNCRRFARQLAIIRLAGRQAAESEGINAIDKALTPEAKARILQELASREKGHLD